MIEKVTLFKSNNGEYSFLVDMGSEGLFIEEATSSIDGRLKDCIELKNKANSGMIEELMISCEYAIDFTDAWKSGNYAPLPENLNLNKYEILI